MANYNLTVTTGAVEEKGLALYLSRVNADRAAEVPPKAALTKAELLQRVINNAVLSTAGGAVSGHTFTVEPGTVVQAKFVPDGGGTQPTDLYDLTIVDTDGLDVLFGAGANLSNANKTTSVLSSPYLQDGSLALDVVVANAGNAKGGRVDLWIQLK